MAVLRCTAWATPSAHMPAPTANASKGGPAACVPRPRCSQPVRRAGKSGTRARTAAAGRRTRGGADAARSARRTAAQRRTHAGDAGGTHYEVDHQAGPPGWRSLACMAVPGAVAHQQLSPLQRQAGRKLHVPAGRHPRQVGQPAFVGGRWREVARCYGSAGLAQHDRRERGRLYRPQASGREGLSPACFICRPPSRGLQCSSRCGCSLQPAPPSADPLWGLLPHRGAHFPT